MKSVSIPALLVSLIAASPAYAQESYPNDQAGEPSGIVDSAVRTASAWDYSRPPSAWWSAGTAACSGPELP